MISKMRLETGRVFKEDSEGILLFSLGAVRIKNSVIHRVLCPTKKNIMNKKNWLTFQIANLDNEENIILIKNSICNIM